MKYLYFFLLVLAISACNRNKYVEFNGIMTGVNNGAFVVEDQQGKQLISVFITDGKFQAKTLLPAKGFYDVYITPDIETHTSKRLFEMYLEGGTYTISADKDKMYLYPAVKSDSKIQNELSDYYSIALKQQHDVVQQQDSINDMLYSPNTPVVVKSPEYYALLKQLNEAKQGADSIQAKALGNFVTKNPQNEVEAFLLSQIDYKKQPKDYYTIYQKFTDEQKKTPEGRQEGDELLQLVKSKSK
ncbi:hypothetical protein [Mucilaginibacter sp.]